MQSIGCHTNKIIIIIISGTTRPGIFTNFLVHVTYTAEARSSSGGVAISLKGKGKVFPYSLPSVGPGADPGVQAVSPLVT